MSPSALFRSIGSEGGLPTILFDEIDTVFGAKAKEHEELRGLLNAGHRRGAKTYRSVVRGKVIEVEAIEAYAAVALAGLGWLPDTLLSRSIVIRMRRRHAGEQVEPFRRRIHHPAGAAIRHKIETWAAAFPTSVTWPDLPAQIQDRDADKWEPLIAIADFIGGQWPERARGQAIALIAAAKNAEPSLGIQLLSDLRTVFGDAKEMPTEGILAKLHNLKEAPWNDLKGKPLNDRGLAMRLRQYEVKPTVLSGGAHRGYRREDLHDAWERYLAPLPPDGTVTGVTSVTGGEVTDVTDVTLVAGEERDNPGLSSRAIDSIAHEVGEWAYECRHNGGASEGDTEAEIRRRLIGLGVLQEAIEIEIERVTQRLFTTVNPNDGDDDLDIPMFLRRS